MNSAFQHTLVSETGRVNWEYRETPGAIVSEWLGNHTENSCASSPHASTFNIFHLVYLTVQVSLLGGNKVVSLGIY